MARKTGCIAAIVTGVVSAVLFAILAVSIFPELERLAGIAVFDGRSGGYDVETARAIATGIRDNAFRFYLTRALPLDLVFPGLFALSVVLTMSCLGQYGLPPGWRRVALALGLGAAAADYLENLLGLAMVLGASVDVIAPFASVMTMAKTYLYGAVVLAVTLCVGWVLWIGWISGSRSRRRG